MRWEDERYVRIYTRNTADWAALEWTSRAVFYELSRNVDRAGILTVGKSGLRGVAAVLMMPVDVVEAGLAELVEDGCVQRSESRIVIRNFLDAQEAQQSNAQRKREQRARDRLLAMGTLNRTPESVTKRDESSQNVTETAPATPGAVDRVSNSPAAFFPLTYPPVPTSYQNNQGASVTKRDFESQIVTKSHAESHGVTSGHAESHGVTPCLAVPSLAVPNKQTSAPPPEPGSGSLLGSDEASGSVKEAKSDLRREQAKELFAYWRDKFQKNARTKFDGLRLSRTLARLKDYSLEDLKRAVDGCAASPWHVAEGRTDLELICRDSIRVDQFLEYARNPRRAERAPGSARPGERPKQPAGEWTSEEEASGDE